MKRLVLFLLFLSYSFAVNAQVRYVVHNISAGKVFVDGKSLEVGSVFSEKDSIEWSNDKQCMKVMNQETKQLVVMTAKCMKISAVHNMKDYMSFVVPLSSRAIGATNWSDTLNLAIARSMMLYGPYKAEGDKTYYLSFDYNKESVNKVLRQDGYNIIFDLFSIFEIDGVSVIPSKIFASLYFYDTKNNTRELISDKIIITPIDKRSITIFSLVMQGEDVTLSDLMAILSDYVRIHYPSYYIDENDLNECVRDIVMYPS